MLKTEQHELNNIKAGCCIGEVLLNHFTFADDICVFVLVCVVWKEY